VDWLQPRPAPAEEGIDWQGPEEARERRQETDGVDGPVGVGQRHSDRGLVVHIGTDRLQTHFARPEERRHALRMARDSPHPEASIEQMPDHPATQKTSRAEHYYKPSATLNALPGTGWHGRHCSRLRW
jgi:hypothetical protein